MASELPPALSAALERALDGVARRGLAERARRTSDAYRSGKGSAGVIRNTDDALAYALTRLPATYAACRTVFGWVQDIAPSFEPGSLLDAGVGPGAASWAAVETWAAIEAAFWLDESAPFLALSARLAEDGPPALQHADARRANLTAPGDWPVADLVVASYALAEVPADRQAATVVALWEACGGVLALVEPGTPAGYRRLLAARDGLITAGARILAPCPHTRDCPLIEPDWCHFSVRLPRSRDHRLVKGVAVPFEDEKFAYLVAARPAVTVTTPASRILARPRPGKPGVELKLCTSSGAIERRPVARRDKAAFARVRRADWGDAWD